MRARFSLFVCLFVLTLVSVNRLGNDGANVLIDALKVNKSLTKINFSCTPTSIWLKKKTNKFNPVVCQITILALKAQKLWPMF
jgi:hypothetical protein